MTTTKNENLSLARAAHERYIKMVESGKELPGDYRDAAMEYNEACAKCDTADLIGMPDLTDATQIVRDVETAGHEVLADEIAEKIGADITEILQDADTVYAAAA